ncbi:MAG: FlgD immunoglobulin-like domain containing protein [Candidatus Cloacimonetes bacterium]|nr:FlgD immunoglobulin-like domain containing protein [Candidatus Cloacimonadota bacterium]
MKRMVLLVLLLSCSMLIARSASEGMEPTRSLKSSFHSVSYLWLRTTNFGCLGSGDYIYPQYPSLEYPAGSGIDYLFLAAPWISAKKYRRNAYGNRLYWPVYPPYASTVPITEDSPVWNSSMHAVLDTLTSVGFEGDDDLHELLPAYNPLLVFNPDVSALYEQYNGQDKVLSSWHGYPSPRPFIIPDPEGNYCFTIPQETTFETPGSQTHSAYYYDYCPFNSMGDRDYGSSSSSSYHIPLGLAIHQESYAWDIPIFSKTIIIKYNLYNTSAIDTLYDLALANYFDADIGPQTWGSEKARDDKSGYISGAWYEFAYSYDADHDGGLSTGYVANKLYIPGFTGNNTAWYWSVGDGPDDSNPLNLNPTNRTANEKYWLATGRNPNSSKYVSLCPAGVSEYEQPSPNDTRFLNTLYGNLPSQSNPNPQGRINLAPGASFTYYSVVFCGDSIDELKQMSVMAEVFIDSGLQLGYLEGLPCIPYLTPISIQAPSTFALNWHSGNNPDHFEVMYKPYSDPASQWQSIVKPGDARSHSISNLNPTTWYEMKVASIYNPGPGEVYLESQTQLVNYQYITPNEDLLNVPGVALSNYPNPFKPNTTVQFELKEAGETTLTVFNIKGQVVKTLVNKSMSSGSHNINWDGRDNNDSVCSSGIYYLRLTSGTQMQQRKMLLLK